MMKMRIYNENVDVIVEGDNQPEIFKKFVEEHPEELHNAVYLEIVELPETPLTPDELLELYNLK